MMPQFQQAVKSCLAGFRAFHFGCITILILYFAVCPLYGQTALQELKHILEQYRKDKVNLDYRLTYAYYTGKTQVPTDTISMWLTQNGADYHLKAKGFEWIKEGDQLLWVDHEKHEMVLQSTEQATANASHSLDQLEKMALSGEYKMGKYTNGKGDKNIVLTHEEDPDTNLEITYDPKTFFILRTVAHYPNEDEPTQNVKVVTLYRNYKLQAGIFVKRLKNYLSLTGKQYKVTKRYSRYVLQVI